MDRKEIIKSIEYNAALEALKHGIEYPESLEDLAVYGYEFAMSHLWKDAQGDDLPDYGREVIVLVQHLPEYADSFCVSFGHRPNPKEYVVVKGEKLYARTYDKGWNQPNVRY